MRYTLPLTGHMFICSCDKYLLWLVITIISLTAWTVFEPFFLTSAVERPIITLTAVFLDDKPLMDFIISGIQKS